MEKSYDLPAFAFLSDGRGGDVDGRNVILHVRSMSVLEVLEAGKVVLDDDVRRLSFTYHTTFGTDEKYVIALHLCATLDVRADWPMIKETIVKPAVAWFCEYMDWEDQYGREG